MRLEDEANAPAVVPPCPGWCTREPGHLDFEVEGDGQYLREHDAYSGGGLAWVSAEERSDGKGGPVILSPPVLRVDGTDYHGEEWSPIEVRALAAEILRAADVLERLTGAAPVLDDRGQTANLDEYVPRNR